MIKVVAMAPDEVKYTASQFGPGVQIVSRPPDLGCLGRHVRPLSCPAPELDFRGPRPQFSHDSSRQSTRFEFERAVLKSSQ